MKILECTYDEWDEARLRYESREAENDKKLEKMKRRPNFKVPNKIR